MQFITFEYDAIFNTVGGGGGLTISLQGSYSIPFTRSRNTAGNVLDSLIKDY